jgi:hypothetical protein
MKLTTSPPTCAECHEIWEPKPPGTLWVGPHRACFTFFLTFYTGVTEVQSSHPPGQTKESKKPQSRQVVCCQELNWTLSEYNREYNNSVVKN